MSLSLLLLTAVAVATEASMHVLCKCGWIDLSSHCNISQIYFAVLYENTQVLCNFKSQFFPICQHEVISGHSPACLNMYFLILVLLVSLVVRIVITIETNLVRCVDVCHCSLRENGLTSTGAIALSRALQRNKSLEELKWVAKWINSLHYLTEIICEGCKNSYIATSINSESAI